MKTQTHHISFFTSINTALLCLILVFFSTNSFAQTLSVSPTSVKVAKGQTFTITYTLDGGVISDLQAPSFDNFYIAGGPNESQSIQFVNGNVSKTSSITYILQAKQQGKFVIPPATATVEGKTLRSSKVSVSVGQGAKNAQPKAKIVPQKKNKQRQSKPQTQNFSIQPGLRPAKPKPKPAIKRSPKGNVFLKVVVDTPQIYQGEQITAIYRLYTTVDVTNYTISGAPSLTGFWAQDITPDRRQVPKTEVIDSVMFRTFDLKKYALFPQRSGELEIDPMTMELDIRIPVAGGRSFFKQYRTQKSKIESKPLKINIVPLPEEGKPANFSGAVGKFNVRAKLDKRQVKVNEAAEIEVVISGNGNVKLMDAPSINFPESFESFEPSIKEDNYERNNIVGGRKIFQYPFVPTEAGNYKIPSIEYSYFDPVAKKYETIKSPNYQIVVAADEAALAANKEKAIGLHTIKNSLRLQNIGSGLFGSFLFWSLFLLPLIFLPIFWWRYQARQAELSDTIGLKRKKANKVATKRLASAKGHMQRNDKKAFYDEIIHAIWGYLSDKLNMPPSELSKSNIASVLTQKEVNNQYIQKLTDTIAYCEMALFAPVANADNLKGTYQNAVELVTSIEEELVKKSA